MIEIDPNNPPQTTNVTVEELRTRLLARLAAMSAETFQDLVNWNMHTILKICFEGPSEIRSTGSGQYQVTQYHPVKR
jgi:hypothetical protein